VRTAAPAAALTDLVEPSLGGEDGDVPVEARAGSAGHGVTCVFVCVRCVSSAQKRPEEQRQTATFTSRRRVGDDFDPEDVHIHTATSSGASAT